ncbi:MAG: flagellar biosynthetic protein FliO [Myxococcaceae bacterium]|nr:flagellar biosynthetic protein FliO [Myxococcaceae bacterium]
MTLLLLAVLAAEPAAPEVMVPAQVPSLRAPAPATPVSSTTGPAIPPADVPEEVMREADESMGFLLFRTFVVLGLVVMLAWVSLNWGLRRMLGLKGPSSGGNVVNVIERVPLDQRHTLFVVKAASEYLLVGGADGSLGLISKLDTAEVDRLRAEQPAPLTLSPLLQKLLARKGASK